MSDAWKESSGNFWKPEKAEDSVMGILIKVESKVGPNESMLYHLKKSDGTLIQVWGSTILDSRMAPIMVGQEVRITYKGLAEKGGRGKNKPKIFKVEYRDVESVDPIDQAFDEAIASV